MDRLVRQGRAFGIHVLSVRRRWAGLQPGPQHHRSNGGAHRLAVQRGRRPPHSQQGERRRPAAVPARRGIYNAANGLLEGNNLFQIVWISDQRRATTISKKCGSWPRGLARPQIVFEGSAPSASDSSRTAACNGCGVGTATRSAASPAGWANRSPSRIRPRPCFSGKAAPTSSWPVKQRNGLSLDGRFPGQPGSPARQYRCQCCQLGRSGGQSWQH